MLVWMTRCLLLVTFFCEAGNDCGESPRGSQLGLNIQFPLNIRLPLLCHCCGIVALLRRETWEFTQRTHSQPFPCMHVFTVVISMKNCNHDDDDSHSNASGKEVQLSKTAEFFLTPRLLSVKGWLLRRRQLLNDQWWQSIEEKAAREEFSHIKPNRAWSQDCPGLTIAWQCLTCLDGLMCCRGTGAMVGVEEDGQSLLLSWQRIQGKASRRSCSCSDRSGGMEPEKKVEKETWKREA